MIFNIESNEIIENDEDGNKNEFDEIHANTESGEDEYEEHEISKICMNCGDFIQAPDDYSNNFGICLREPEFEEYIDEMFDNNDFSGCIEHYNAKRFDGDIDSCEHFYVPEEADDELIENHEIEYKYRNADPSNISEKLFKGTPDLQKSIIRQLDLYVRFGNKKAFELLLEFLRSLPAVQTLEEANFRIYLLKTISAYKNHKKWVNPLVDELFRTDSNQKTRKLFTFILDTLRSQYEDDLALEALQSLLMRRKFSPKMKNRINETISWIYERRAREFESEFWFRPVPDWVDAEDE